MRKQFTFYRSFYEAAKALKPGDRLKLYDALCAYALDEQEVTLTGTPSILFELIRPTLDTSKRKAESGRRGGKAESKTETNDKQTGSKAQAKRKQSASENEIEKENEIEIEKENEIEKESYNARARVASTDAQKPEPLKAGEFGWVKLTQEQLNRLVQEHGQAAVDEAIRYVDELAQSTSNKNKWRDWNLVVRRCIREGWGKREARPLYGKGKGAQPAPGDMRQPVAQELDEFERCAIEKMRGGGA